MPRRRSSPIDDFFSDLDYFIKRFPDVLQDAVISLATVAIVQAFLSTYLPVWLVTVGVAGYAVFCLYREGLAVLHSRKLRVFGITLMILLVDLYFTFAV